MKSENRNADLTVPGIESIEHEGCLANGLDRGAEIHSRDQQPYNGSKFRGTRIEAGGLSDVKAELRGVKNPLMR